MALDEIIRDLEVMKLTLASEFWISGGDDDGSTEEEEEVAFHGLIALLPALIEGSFDPVILIVGTGEGNGARSKFRIPTIYTGDNTPTSPVPARH